MKGSFLFQLLIAAALAQAPAAANSSACLHGAYRLSNGQIIAIGASADDALRYRTLSGQTGRLYRQASGEFSGGLGWSSPPPPVSARLIGRCGSDQIRFSAPGIPLQQARRVRLSVSDVTFASGSTVLRGRLVTPAGATKTPLAVWVHGSEDNSAIEVQTEQWLLPASGVSMFIYDKRGTGKSQGKYTQDFDVLSGDAVAAMTQAKKILGRRTSSAGFWGSSQGGWVAPLAATKSAADFVVVGYGMAQGPLDEDREEVFDNLRRAGYGDDVLAKAREITDATAKIMRSGFKDGFSELDAARAKYRDAPWYRAIKGEFTGDILPHPEDVIRAVGPTRDRGTSWDYDALGTLQRVNVPMLWVLAGDDQEAPSATTIGILRDLQDEKAKLDVAVYPGTDHGIIRFVEKSGEREPIGYARSYLPLVIDWMKTKRLRPRPDVTLYPDRR